MKNVKQTTFSWYCKQRKKIKIKLTGIYFEKFTVSITPFRRLLLWTVHSLIFNKYQNTRFIISSVEYFNGLYAHGYYQRAAINIHVRISISRDCNESTADGENRKWRQNKSPAAKCYHIIFYCIFGRTPFSEKKSQCASVEQRKIIRFRRISYHCCFISG